MEGTASYFIVNFLCRVIITATLRILVALGEIPNDAYQHVRRARD
jgi:hypothetical protein